VNCLEKKLSQVVARMGGVETKGITFMGQPYSPMTRLLPAGNKKHEK
jgi:hypothetical protein